MAIELIQEIGDQIKSKNSFFDTYGVNGIQLPSGQVIKFSDNKEKKYIGIDDCSGNTFYIRFNPSISYTANERIFTSCQSPFNALVSCRLVAFSFDNNNRISSDKLMKKLIHDLKNISWNDITKPQIIIKKSNLSYYENFTEETKQVIVEQEFVCISIDFDIKYFVAEVTCDPCDVFIGDETNNVCVKQVVQSDLDKWLTDLTGPDPSQDLFEALNTLMFCLEFKKDLEKDDLFHIIAGLETDAQRLKPLKSTSGLDFTPVNSPILGVNGMTSGSGYLDLNWNPTLHGIKYTAASQHFAIYKDASIYNSLLSSSGAWETGPFKSTGIIYAKAFNQVFAGMRSPIYNAFSAIYSFKTILNVKRNNTIISIDTAGQTNANTFVNALDGVVNKNLYLGTANGLFENGDGRTYLMVSAGAGDVSTLNYYNCIQEFMTKRGVQITPP